MTQTFALILEAYRELNAKKLFWITLVLSVLVGSVFALVGINERGITLLAWELPIPMNSNVISEETFYKTFFNALGTFWLTWVATILAIVSTSSIFPDFVSSGSVEMMLSRPISRIQLYLTKYVLGLMFVLGQVGAFSVAAFLSIGVRGGVWMPGLLISIPIVLLFFSYLFSVSALVGTITRSTIATLLATILFWTALGGLNFTDTIMLSIKSQTSVQLESERGLLANMETITQRQIDRAREDGVETIADAERPEGIDELEAANPMIYGKREDVQRLEKSLASIETWHGWILGVKTVLPKTSDTIGLLERVLVSDEEIESLMSLGDDGGSDEQSVSQDAQQKAVEEARARPLSWIIGTSLVFEFLVLALGALIFARRDY